MCVGGFCQHVSPPPPHAAVGRLLFCSLAYIVNTSILLCSSYCAVPATECGDCCLILSLILIYSVNRLLTDLIDDIICVLWFALHVFDLISLLVFFCLHLLSLFKLNIFYCEVMFKDYIY